MIQARRERAFVAGPPDTRFPGTYGGAIHDSSEGLTDNDRPAPSLVEFSESRVLSAVQLELLFMVGVASTRYKGSPVSEFQEFCS